MKTVLASVFFALFLLAGCVTPANNQTATPTTTEILNGTPTTAPKATLDFTIGECKTNADCVTAGCSSQLCVSRKSKEIVTSCEYKEEYSCFKKEGCGCIAGKCSWSAETQACVFQVSQLAAVRECVSLCEKQKIDLRAGPCLSQQIAPGWVCDVAHSPREEVDGDRANQCAEYGKTASHFVEVTPQCTLIRAV